MNAEKSTKNGTMKGTNGLTNSKKRMEKKGNMYEFVDRTWNPLGGECPHRCSYCSTNSLKRFPLIRRKYSGAPCIDLHAFEKMTWRNQRVFVVAQNDLFAEGVPDEIINLILERCRVFPNDYFFQTKNPSRIDGFMLPERATVCTTIETNRHYKEMMKDSPTPYVRSLGMYCIDKPKHLTIEPIMDFDLIPFVEMIKTCNVEQVNIGADSKRNNLPEPSKEKIEALIKELEKFATVHIKSNLKRLL